MKTVLIVAMSAALAACSGNGTQAGGGAGADSAVEEVKTIADVPAAQGRADSEEAAVDDVENFATFFDKFKEFVEISSLEGFHNKVAALFQELLSKPQCFLI